MCVWWGVGGGEGAMGGGEGGRKRLHKANSGSV